MAVEKFQLGSNLNFSGKFRNKSAGGDGISEKEVGAGSFPQNYFIAPKWFWVLEQETCAKGGQVIMWRVTHSKGLRDGKLHVPK